MKSWFRQCFYKTKSISQNLQQGPNVLKNKNTTKSKAWLKLSSEMIPRMPLYKIKNRLGDDSRYLTISHKKRFVPNVNVLDFVREFFGGIQTLSNTEQKLKMGQFLILLLCERFGLWSLQCWNDILREKNWTTFIYIYDSFMHIVFDDLIGSGSGANSGSMIMKWKSHIKTIPFSPTA